MQTLNPNKEVWEPGPRLSKFLQDQFEWDLYDVVERKTENNDIPDHSVNGAPTTLKAIAHHQEQSIDALFDANHLRVVISRDPQKIGEMSTGQRWRSCMARDGSNYRYVPKDIEAGSLVAYVVHKDDPEARYPLMRQLLKPFRNDKGETILVPAFIYGGSGNASSRTSDALKHTLNAFVAKQNAHKTGTFSMDSALYPDGQAVTAKLEENWSQEGINKAIEDYRKGALQEWMMEIRGCHETWSRVSLSPDDPVLIAIKKLKSKIRRVFEIDNTETGLPRMFYREMQRSSIGTIPGAGTIVEAISANKDLALDAKGFKALLNGDKAGWEHYSRQLTLENGIDSLLKFPLYAAAIAEPGSAGERMAISIWQKEAGRYPPEERLFKCRDLLELVPYCQELKEYAVAQILTIVETIKNLESAQAVEFLCLALKHATPDSPEVDRGVSKLLADIDGCKKSTREQAIVAVIKHAREGSVEQDKAMQLALKGIKTYYSFSQEGLYEKIARHYSMDSQERTLAVKKLLHLGHIKKIPASSYEDIEHLTPPGTPLSWEVNTLIIKKVRSSPSSEIDRMFSLRQRLAGEAAKHPQARKLFEQAGDLILERCRFKGGKTIDTILPNLIRENEELGPLSSELVAQTRRARSFLGRKVEKADDRPIYRFGALLQVKIAKVAQDIVPQFAQQGAPARRAQALRLQS